MGVIALEKKVTLTKVAQKCMLELSAIELY